MSCQADMGSPPLQSVGAAPADVVVSPRPISEELLKLAESSVAPVIVLPLREVDGMGVYSEGAVTLVKALREVGVEADFRHPVGSRTFEVKKSLIVETMATMAIGVLSNAAWEAIKTVLGRRNSNRSKLDLTYVQRNRQNELAEAWNVSGSSEAVLEAIDKLRATPGDTPQPGIPLASPSSHQTAGSDITNDQTQPSSGILPAGSDEDRRLWYQQQQIRDRRLQGDTLLADSAMKLACGQQPRLACEQLARRGLLLLARSLDWAEDTEFESEAHRRLDEAGLWVRQTFDCYLDRNGSEYQQTCPVAIAHNRLGLSIGGLAVRTCSLCGEDFSECDHYPGTAYLVTGGAAELGWCRICGAESCHHTPDDREHVQVMSIIREMRLEEVSLVSKPADPEARLTAISVTTEELQESLGPQFTPGMDVSCDKCLTTCRGLIKHDHRRL